MAKQRHNRFKNITVEWDDAHHWSPAPRHRRRLIFKTLRRLAFETCLDVGCAQPYLLEFFHAQGKKVCGCDISDQVVAHNRKILPGCSFTEVDVSRQTYPGGRQFDLVVSSEVLEHIPQWQAAVKNLCRMSRRYLLITVPSGKVHAIDKKIGHIRHFQGTELKQEVEKQGFAAVRLKHWGFPMHSFYKYAINSIAPDRIYENFGTAQYSMAKKILSQVLYLAFFVNDLFAFGQQLILLAEKKPKGPSPA
ncbi:class I SAM-dependent methyltransferase [candidate division FCPU426 bacterium]|nr:class I SAM-dependent methyltransferase [candidate division FCPU426 bacterium]